MENEYLIMDDREVFLSEPMTPEMSATYENIKAAIEADFSDILSD